MKPLAIDLYCGLGGWTDGLLAEGFYVVGFDIERHDYGTGGYPAQLVLQDVSTLHGRQFKDAALIVASPPCQEFSYMAMPWSLAKAKRARILADASERKRLTALFDSCFRIQREAIEAAGHHIPLVVENVRGACEWVGRSRWNYGSFHLWGDVPALMPMTKAIKVPGFRFDGSGKSFQTASVDGLKWGEGQSPGRRFDERPGGNVAAHRERRAKCDCQNPEPKSGVALISMECPVHNWNPLPQPEGTKTQGHTNKRDGARHTKHLTNPAEYDGTKLGGSWFHEYRKGQGPRNHGSGSKARKAASAAIAKIPFPLSSHIAKYWKPAIPPMCGFGGETK